MGRNRLSVLWRIRTAIKSGRRRAFERPNLAESMFEPREQNSMLVGPPLPPGVLSKSKTEHFKFSLSEMPSLAISDHSGCAVKIMGADTEEYSVDFHVDVQGRGERGLCHSPRACHAGPARGIREARARDLRLGAAGAAAFLGTGDRDYRGRITVAGAPLILQSESQRYARWDFSTHTIPRWPVQVHESA